MVVQLDPGHLPGEGQIHETSSMSSGAEDLCLHLYLNLHPNPNPNLTELDLVLALVLVLVLMLPQCKFT